MGVRGKGRQKPPPHPQPLSAQGRGEILGGLSESCRRGGVFLMGKAQDASTSASLLVKIQDAQDTAAWQRFFATYRPMIEGWCRGCGLPDADRDEVAGVVLLRQEPGPTPSEAVVGTPRYMAPEQAAGHRQQVGPATDIYALGAILYELLTGRPPFQSATLLETLDQVRFEEPVPPRRLNLAVGRDLETICLKCLRKEPACRYASAAELADDLERWRRGQPILARPVGPMERLGRWCWQNPTVAGLTAAVALLLVTATAVAVGFALFQRQANRDLSRANRDLADQKEKAEQNQREAEASDAQAQELLNELLQSNSVALYTRSRPYSRTSSPGCPMPMSCTVRGPTSSVCSRGGPAIPGSGSPSLSCGAAWAACTACRASWPRWTPALPAPATCGTPWHANIPATRTTAIGWPSPAAGSQTAPTFRDISSKSVRWYLRAYALWQELAEEQPDNVSFLRPVVASRSGLLALRDPESCREEARHALEEERVLLGKRLGEGPAGTALRKRLALVCLALGELHLGKHPQPAAVPYWRQAYEHYRLLAQEQPDDPLVLLSLALCCSRLMAGQSADSYYTEAVSLFARATHRLAALAERYPARDWPRATLLETYCALAVCHAQAGRPALAQQTFEERVRPLVAQGRGHSDDGWPDFSWLGHLLHAADVLQENKPAALAMAREAATLAERYADTPVRDPMLCERLVAFSVNISAFLCRLGDPGTALRLPEQARDLCLGLRRTAPALAQHADGLSVAWERIAKARWALGRREEALAAFREAAAVERQVVAQAPSVRRYRVRLSRCYDRVVHWSRLAGDRAGAAVALLEREKLWPDDAEELMEVARDFQALADAVGQGREPLSPEEEAERRRYLAENERVRRAAVRINGTGAPADKTAADAGKR